MGILENKKILITGVISPRSIAYAVAHACRAQGAEIALTYQSERFRSRLESYAETLGASFLFPCDVSKDEEIDALFHALKSEWSDGIDGLLHAIAYAPESAIKGDFISGCTREAFHTAQDISAYSFCALVRAAKLITGFKPGASCITLTYLGSDRAVPNYNTMGLAKASLESSVRYLARDLGGENIRINGISAGPIKTLAAAGIAGFAKMLKSFEQVSFLRRTITAEEVGDVASFLLSSLSRGMTGEILYVDGGFSRGIGMGLSE